MQKINEYIDQSIADIQSLRDSDFKFYLIQMAKSLGPNRGTKQKPKDEKP